MASLSDLILLPEEEEGDALVESDFKLFLHKWHNHEVFCGGCLELHSQVWGVQKVSVTEPLFVI